jgi:hypothetical protein
MNKESDFQDLSKKFLNLVLIKEDAYKPDLQLLERYQAYSAELLRLSLAGLGVVGFLIMNKLVTQTAVKAWLTVGILLFGVSSGSALAHRYFSSDGIHYFIKAVRLNGRKSPDEKCIKGEIDNMKKKYRIAWMYLRISCVSLALGAMAIAVGFALAAVW